MEKPRKWALPGWDRRQSLKGQDNRRGPRKGLLERRSGVWDRRDPPRWIVLADRQDAKLAGLQWASSGFDGKLASFRRAVEGDEPE